ncbi:MAG TPA: Rieske 2Fe-2S domain-containing protein, partial [Acidimicrobiales bacterium]
MNPLVIVIPVVVVLAGVVLFASARRRDAGAATGALSRETRRRDRSMEVLASEREEPVSGRQVEAQAALERRSEELVGVGGGVARTGARDLAEYVPPDPETVGVTRRQFFNRSIVIVMGFGLSAFGAAVIAFLWPTPKGGFGSKIRVGAVSDTVARIEASDGFLYLAEGRMWITAYPASALEKAAAVYPASMQQGLSAGVIAMYQKCPHLGCRVPSCGTSQWFECPCHGSQYNQAGEKKGGPAPRGMDHFAMEVAGGVLTVNTG